MVSKDDALDCDALKRDVIHADLGNSLEFIIGRTQALRQHVLRANGLLNLERDQLLGGLATMLNEARQMEERLEMLDGSIELLVEEPALPGPATTAPQC